MKKLIASFGLIGILLVTWSCNNELDLIDEWKNIPVVYGLLSQSDEAHYIRVEKAFIDPTTSAFEIAQRPDSLYYDSSVAVEIERISTGERIQLSRVDGNDIGLVREDGIFATAPNILYRFTDADIELVTNESYRLIVTDANDQILTEATTTVTGEFERLSNQPRNPINWRSGSPLTIGWRNEDEMGNADQSSVFFDVRMLIHFREQDPQTGVFEDKKLEWLIQKEVERPYSNNTDRYQPQIDVSVAGFEFYQFLAANLEQTPNIRIFQNIDILIDAGGQELFDYINIGQANTGITSAQAIPTFSNLSEGIGLFSSRNRIVFEGYNIDTEARDSLRDGSYTRHLNFQ